MAFRTLTELQQALLAHPEVALAEIEGEAPAWLRLDVRDESEVEYVVSLCLMLDWTMIRRTGARTLIVDCE